MLRSGEERTRLILEKSFNAFISIDATGVITEWNAQAESTFGWTRREAIGQKLADTLIPPGMRDAHLNGIQRFIETGAGPVLNRRIEMTAMHRDGHEFSVEMVISPIRHGGTYSFCAFLHDISQRRAAARRLEEDVKVIGERNQELGRQQKIMISLMEDLRESEEKIKKTAAELERSNKELEQFAYIASHDLQEPLRKISSFTQLLAQRYAGRLDKDADEFIGYVVDGAKRMRDLIEDLLTYSRVGRAEIAFERTDMTELMGQITALFDVDRAITAAEITHDPLPTVRANPLLIRQLLQNLISNGIKFHGDSPPRVHVSASRKGGEWIFSVRDNGIGIESQFHDRIFEIFKRLHTTEEFSGTGIGLAVCKKIAERHGGRIWVESTPGGGSTFYFSIPAREGAAADVSGDKSEGGVRS
ncbi:MAG: hypothetical protein A3G34_16875 [Candidatus Lindowbacteria bacterium RIFCSPLOWO2_12_FULL_62_27]|nr:MAG: hypothetical protein A3I06_05280 [Candidatus Lindowbacteria bacterium RIFCSPLOWO2_02_FULL_62_12]OGH62905.1 MAG: hypothetical protein A3G34_16875 [Candidatus Lindowbacteria bacterium RIFCSPLOWO2_12_FULL_62_27]